MTSLETTIYDYRQEATGLPDVWSVPALQASLQAAGLDQSQRTIERKIKEAELLPTCLKTADVRDEADQQTNRLVREQLEETVQRKRTPSLVLQLIAKPGGDGFVLMTNDRRMARRWMAFDHTPTTGDLIGFLDAVARDYQKPARLAA